jgi:hypothetical protein
VLLPVHLSFWPGVWQRLVSQWADAMPGINRDADTTVNTTMVLLTRRIATRLPLSLQGQGVEVRVHVTPGKRCDPLLSGSCRVWDVYSADLGSPPVGFQAYGSLGLRSTVITTDPSVPGRDLSIRMRFPAVPTGQRLEGSGRDVAPILRRLDPGDGEP